LWAGFEAVEELWIITNTCALNDYNCALMVILFMPKSTKSAVDYFLWDLNPQYYLKDKFIPWHSWDENNKDKIFAVLNPAGMPFQLLFFRKEHINKKCRAITAMSGFRIISRSPAREIRYSSIIFHNLTLLNKGRN
jgi:hypothetical protein